MITGSVTAIGPSAAIRSVRRRSTVLPVAIDISACWDQPMALFAGAVMLITMVSVNLSPLIWNA